MDEFGLNENELNDDQDEEEMEENHAHEKEFSNRDYIDNII